MRRSWLAYGPILVAIALAGCGPSSGGTSAGPPPTRPPSSPTATGSEPPSSVVVTPKPGNPTPVATASAANATVLSSDLVDQLAVRCGQDGLELASDRVQAARDGVHLLVSGDPGYTVGLEHESGGDGIEVGAEPQEAVQLIAPGRLTISCGLVSDEWPQPGIDIRIEDPDGLYRPYVIGRGAHACVTGDALYGVGARGPKARPLKQARASLTGLRPGDVVERAGYPVETGRIRVVRGGEVVGVLDYQPDGHGGWLLMGHTTCDGLGGGGG